jgi:hypothetical protein
VCDTCWTDVGSPKDWTPQTAELVALIADLYRIHAVGGPLHSVLDDWNLDGTIEPYYSDWDADDLDALHQLDPPAPAVDGQPGVSTRSLCDRIAAILNDMTADQRYAALAYHDGYLPRPATERAEP